MVPSLIFPWIVVLKDYDGREKTTKTPRAVFIGCNKWPGGEDTAGGTSRGSCVRGGWDGGGLDEKESLLMRRIERWMRIFGSSADVLMASFVWLYAFLVDYLEDGRGANKKIRAFVINCDGRRKLEYLLIRKQRSGKRSRIQRFWRSHPWSRAQI